MIYIKEWVINGMTKKKFLTNNDELLDEYRKHLNQFNQTQLEYNELLLKVNKVKQERDYNQFLFD